MTNSDSIICLESSAPKVPQVPIPAEHFLIYIPSLTMKEIVEKADNKTSDGKPLMYNISWYKDEKFYTEEKAREGWRIVAEHLIGKNLNWNEQEEELKKLGGERLNVAEEIYILYAYEKVKGKRLTYGADVKPYGYEYSWTSSLSSSGEVVLVGAFDEYGVYVIRGTPGR